MDVESIMYFLAGLGLVFFGIKTFSQSLQSITGPFVRYMVNRRTNNLFRLTGIGFIIAIFTQSSFGLSSLVLAYVNAGLLQFSQSINMLLGAQIGFSFMAWFFSVSQNIFATFFLLFLGFIPSLFGQKLFISQLSKTFFGLGLTFLGLQFIDHLSMGLIPYIGHYVSLLPADEGFYQKFILVILASVLFTSLTRSKLLVVAICFALMKSFSFSEFFSLSVIMGLSIGGAIPGALSSANLSSDTRRSAVGYLLFETFFSVLVLVLAQNGLPKLFTLFNLSSSISFCMIYSAYSLIAATIYFVFGPIALDKLFQALVAGANYKEAKKLQLKGNLGDISTALAIDLVEQELKKMSAMVEIQLDLSRANLVSKLENKAVERKVNKYEKITDNIDMEIIDLIRLLMQRSLLEEEVVELRSFSRFSTELESIADAAGDLIYCAKNIREEKDLPADLMRSLRSVGNYLQEFYIQIFTAIMEDESLVDSHDRFYEKLQEELKELQNLQKQMLSEALIDSEANQNLFDIQNCFFRILRHSRNLGEAVSERLAYLKEAR